MQKALVVYESLYGNARQIAEAVAAGLARTMRVEIVEVAAAPATIGADVDLLVVGGPTHQLGMTRPASRRQAVQQYGEPVAQTGTGLREWLQRLDVESAALAMATFDTRLGSPTFLTRLDHAARSEGKMLGKHGCASLAAPEYFIVDSPTGPLADGEPARAHAWGVTLAAKLQQAPARSS